MTSAITKTHKHHHVAITRPTKENEQTEFLKKYDFFVLIDHSGSMKQIEDQKDQITRWDIVKEQLKVVVGHAAELDSNGIDLCFFGTDTVWHENVESESKVERLFKKIQPEGATNLSKALDEVFARHFDKREEKKAEGLDQRSIVLIITDGRPHDGHDEKEAQRKVIDSIVSATHKLNKKEFFTCTDPETKTSSTKTTEIGLRFFQVGSDEAASAYLKKLDIDLVEAKVDIVATGNIEELCNDSSVRDAFLNAIFAQE